MKSCDVNYFNFFVLLSLFHPNNFIDEPGKDAAISNPHVRIPSETVGLWMWELKVVRLTVVCSF